MCEVARSPAPMLSAASALLPASALSWRVAVASGVCAVALAPEDEAAAGEPATHVSVSCFFLLATAAISLKSPANEELVFLAMPPILSSAASGSLKGSSASGSKTSSLITLLISRCAV